MGYAGFACLTIEILVWKATGVPPYGQAYLFGGTPVAFQTRISTVRTAMSSVRNGHFAQSARVVGIVVF